MMGATIKTGDGWSYSLSSEDELWAGRMAQYEGGDPADVLWTMTQAYARPAVHREYPTFAAFIRAYSQPINPIWRRDGSMCAPGGRYAGQDNCAERRLAVRDTAATIPWGELDADIRAAVSEWFSGSMRNPVPKAVEFAAPGVSESFLERHPDAQIVKRLDNWYISTGESQSWPAGWVTMGPGVPWMALGLAALLGGGAAVLIARRRLGRFGGLGATSVEQAIARCEQVNRDSDCGEIVDCLDEICPIVFGRQAVPRGHKIAAERVFETVSSKAMKCSNWYGCAPLRGLSGTVPEHRRKAEELLEQSKREFWKGESRPWSCLALVNAIKAEEEAEWLPGPGGPGTLKHRARSMVKKVAPVCLPDYLGPR